MFLLEENRYIHFLQRSDRYLSNQQEILLKEYSDEASNIINGSKEPMKIVVAGAFNSGKSTLINAFLKSEVMPTNVKRETVTINRLLYGSDFSIEVYFKNDKPPQKIKCDGKDDINNKLREKSNQMASEISSINVYYPDEDSLRYFTIIDTPGFDYSDVDNQKAEEILYQADVVLWLTREFYQNEHQQLTNLKETCKSSVKIIGLMNYIDVLSQEDIVDLSADIKKRSGGIFDEFFPICAKWAFEGATTGESDLYEKSNFGKFNGWLTQNVLEKYYELLHQKVKTETLRFCKTFNLALNEEIDTCEKYLIETKQKSETLIQNLITILKKSYSDLLGNIKKIFDEIEANENTTTVMAALFINRLAMSAPNETNGNKISSQPTKQKTGWLTGLANYSDFSGITNTIIGQTSPTKQKVSDAIDSFKIELSLNEYLQKMDDIVSQCIENLSLAINNEKDANTDFYSVLSYFSTLISNISPADFINVYLMGIVNQNGMNILTHQYLNNVYIQQNVGQLLNLVIDNYSKSIEEMVQIRKDDLLKRTSEKLDAFNIVLKQLNEERNNLLGE